MKTNSSNNKLIFILVLSLIHYALLSYLKYDINDLSISDYSIDYVGNVLNIIITLIFIIGVVVVLYRKSKIDSRRVNFLLLINLVANLNLLLILFINYLLPVNPEEYLFSFPVKKVYVGFLFISSYCVILYSVIYLWGAAYGFEKLYELRVLYRTIFAIIILIIFSLFVVWNVKKYDEGNLTRHKYDYGLIPGAAVWSKGKPSPVFEGRIRKAYELYNKGVIEKIILTGSNAPGEITEADAAKKLLLSLGVNADNLIIENETQQTNEQIKYLRFDPHIAKSKTNVLIISDNFHLTRVLQICKFFSVNAEGISSGHTLTFEKTIFYRTRESIALILFWLFGI